jgi:hypothetical protein
MFSLYGLARYATSTLLLKQTKVLKCWYKLDQNSIDSVHVYPYDGKISSLTTYVNLI